MVLASGGPPVGWVEEQLREIARPFGRSQLNGIRHPKFRKPFARDATTTFANKREQLCPILKTIGGCTGSGLRTSSQRHTQRNMRNCRQKPKCDVLSLLGHKPSKEKNIHFCDSPQFCWRGKKAWLTLKGDNGGKESRGVRGRWHVGCYSENRRMRNKDRQKLIFYDGYLEVSKAR